MLFQPSYIVRVRSSRRWLGMSNGRHVRAEGPLSDSRACQTRGLLALLFYLFSLASWNAQRKTRPLVQSQWTTCDVSLSFWWVPSPNPAICMLVVEKRKDNKQKQVLNSISKCPTTECPFVSSHIWFERESKKIFTTLKPFLFLFFFFFTLFCIKM